MNKMKSKKYKCNVKVSVGRVAIFSAEKTRIKKKYTIVYTRY